MKTIGIVDDHDEQRTSFKRKIGLKLKSNHPEWSTCDIKPFLDIANYPDWILENEISVLILDERLNEVKLENGKHVDYYGSGLVKTLREKFKDFPIYCITSYNISKDLQESLPYFDLILSRSKFDDDIDNYLNLFIRSGTSFYEDHKKDLDRLGEISEKIALGDASDQEILEAKSLQTKLAIPHSSQTLISKEAYLSDIEKQVQILKEMSEQLLRSIKSS